MDSIFGNHEAKNTSSLNTKYIFVWIQLNIIMTTPKENVSKVPWMVLLLLLMSWEVVKVWLHDVLDIMKGIGHGSLECSSGTL